MNNIPYRVIFTLITLIMVLEAAAQTRNVTLRSFESDSIERANLGNRKFHSAVKNYNTYTNFSDNRTDSNHFQISPLADLSIGTQSEYNNKYYNALIGVNASYSYGQKLTVSLSMIGGYTSPLRTIAALADSLNHMPGFDGSSKKSNNRYFEKYAEFYVNYIPASFLKLSAGKGKKFIGDGYRSVIMSASNSGMYYFDTDINVGNCKYVFSINGGRNYDNTVDAFRTSYMIYHLISYNPARWLTLGGYETVMMIRRDSVGNTKMPDIHYINPMLFFRPLEYSLGSPDNALMGLFGKLRYLKNHILYGEFMLDDFNHEEIVEHNDTWNNKYSYQLGAKGFVGNFSYLLEYNYIRPYIYSHDKSVNSYSMYAQPLANPYGANLKEIVANFKYKFSNFGFELLIDYIKYGKDFQDQYSLGNNILRPYTERHHNRGNVICQGDLQKNCNVVAIAEWKPNVLRWFSVYAMGGTQHTNSHNNNFLLVGIKTNKLFFDNSL